MQNISNLTKEIMKFIDKHSSMKILETGEKRVTSDEIYMSNYGAKLTNSKSIYEFDYLQDFIINHPDDNFTKLMTVKEFTDLGYILKDDFIQFTVDPIDDEGFINIEYRNFNNHFRFVIYIK